MLPQHGPRENGWHLAAPVVEVAAFAVWVWREYILLALPLELARQAAGRAEGRIVCRWQIHPCLRHELVVALALLKEPGVIEWAARLRVQSEAGRMQGLRVCYWRADVRVEETLLRGVCAALQTFHDRQRCQHKHD